MPPPTIFFITTMEDDRWGGSEELWSQAAVRLIERGHRVRVSLKGWSHPHARVETLARLGVELVVRPPALPLWRRGLRKATGALRARNIWLGDLDRALRQAPPDLVVISEGGNLPPVELLEFLAPRHPFVLVTHSNRADWWPTDEAVRRIRPALARASRWFFVSEGNRRLAETQLASPIGNSGIVRNPYNVSFRARCPWPAGGPEDTLRLACVGSIDPRSKGQDLLFEALVAPAWRSRDWQLTLYGGGPMRDGLERLAGQLGLANRVRFAGHVDGIAHLWAEEHVLVQPSRYEGLPLSVVEAMLCARPVIATDVAGHGEVIIDGCTGFLAASATAASIGHALERAWQCRGQLEAMGETAARHIRAIMPEDPAGVFADEIVALSTDYVGRTAPVPTDERLATVTR